MSIFKDILHVVLQNDVCYHCNQRAAVLMSCQNTEETVLAYDSIHLDYIVALTKWIENISRCALCCYPPLLSIKSTDTWCLV